MTRAVLLLLCSRRAHRGPIARCLAAIALVVVIAASAAASDAGFVYALRDVSGGPNQIYGFRLDSGTGALTLLPGFPINTGGTGEGSVVSERVAYMYGRLYVINDGDDTLSAFTVDPSTGALTALPFSPIALGSGTWYCVAVHPTGSPVVVGDSNSRLASFVVTATTAVPATGSPFSTGAATPFSCGFSHDGSFVYTGGNIGNTLAGFNVNATTGVLTALAGSPFDSGGPHPLAFATDTSGRLFSADASSEIRAFTTDGTTGTFLTTGIPVGVTGNPFASGLLGGIHGLVHPSGFYMVADRNGNSVGVYGIGCCGATTTLSAVTGSPFASGGTFTDALALTSDGGLLIAANGDTRNLTVFQVNAGTGGLTSLGVQAANAGRHRPGDGTGVRAKGGKQRQFRVRATRGRRRREPDLRLPCRRRNGSVDAPSRLPRRQRRNGSWLLPL